MSDYLTTPPVHPCLECNCDPCVCDVSIGDHTTTVDMWKAKLAAVEARIAELLKHCAELEAALRRLVSYNAPDGISIEDYDAAIVAARKALDK